MTDANNPCLTCGACCAHFRVSFYWAETEALLMPETMTEKIDDRYLCMAGTNSTSPRCVALQGEVGGQASCSIYIQRPSPCHEVQVGDERCFQARQAWGLGEL